MQSAVATEVLRLLEKINMTINFLAHALKIANERQAEI